ncbi:MAG: DMT family transporter [Gemmatimonadota bacterium]|nr:DMT family transporter [Gemmatimonadota bacterium]MDE3127017.1 DMT family transporter [Gemmatimonadota bacterium]MDE3174469.1 DMT family transporter [Gemmatimonadota bacterium]MDE3216530.1 DMT family transporter [Gemmatimonadota bacterium]
MTATGAPATTRASGWRATGYIVISATGFGAIPILTSLATRAGAGLLNALAWRYLLGTAILALLAGGAGSLRAPWRRLLPVIVLAGGAQAFIAFVSLSALDYMPAAPLSFLFYTYPAWVTVIEAVRGAERLTPRRLTALLLSLAGITVMIGARSVQSLHPVGVALALVSAFAYALYIPLVGFYQEQLSETIAAVYPALGAGAILLALDVATNRATLGLTRDAWLPIAAMGLWSTAIAFTAFLRGLHVLGPVRTAIVSTIEPFWTALLGGWVLGQRVTGATLIGGLLIAAAVVLLQLRRARGPGAGPAVES